MVWGGSVNSLAFILKNYYAPAWEGNILKQLPHLTALQIIQSSYFSCEEYLTMAVYHYANIKHVLRNITYIAKRHQSCWPKLKLSSQVMRHLS